MATRRSALIRRSFVSGVLLVAPPAVTLFVFSFAFGWLVGLVDQVVRWAGPERLAEDVALVVRILAIVILVVVITFLGYLAQRGLGRRVFGRMGRVMNVIPLLSVVYGSVRQVADSLVERSSRYEDVVLVGYPHADSYVIGFVTGETPPELQAAVDRPTTLVYVPNSPNPTGGRMLVVPDDRLHETEMSIRNALRTTVTTGMATDGQVEPVGRHQPGSRGTGQARK
ncbi:MAG: DUF502 domain-containing protein [Halobacteriales archaeon]